MRARRVFAPGHPGWYPRVGATVRITNPRSEFYLQEGTVLRLRGLGRVQVKLQSGVNTSIETRYIQVLGEETPNEINDMEA